MAIITVSVQLASGVGLAYFIYHFTTGLLLWTFVGKFELKLWSLWT